MIQSYTRHNTVKTSIAVVTLRASQMSSIEINNEKLVVLNRIVFFFVESPITNECHCSSV